MYGRTTYRENRLFLNNQEVSGVTAFEGSFEVPIEYTNILGSYYGAESKEGQDSKRISITKYLIPNDPIRNFTGDASCNGILLYKDTNYSFNSGFLTNYSVSCSAGEISTVTTDFDIYGLVGGEILPTFYPSNQSITDLPVAHFGNIHITTDEGTTNRIVSFTLNITCNRIPFFGLGSQYPIQVHLNRPLELDLTLSVEVDDYECNNIQTILCGSKKNIFLELKDCSNTNVLENFMIPNAKVISENISTSIDNPTTVEINYKSYLI